MGKDDTATPSEMGFDLFIQLCLHMCPERGKPFYYGTNPDTGKIDKIYELPQVEIPKKYRKYLYGRGHYLHVYTGYFNQNDVYDVSTNVFLEHFPTWDTFAESEYYTDDDPDAWTQENHEGFRKLLVYLSKQEYPFAVSWSY